MNDVKLTIDPIAIVTGTQTLHLNLEHGQCFVRLQVA